MMYLKNNSFNMYFQQCIYYFFYRENLEKLINEKSFKSELVMFRVDSESEAILPDHRPLLMPLIMR